jgi:hypothetical protein
VNGHCVDFCCLRFENLQLILRDHVDSHACSVCLQLLQSLHPNSGRDVCSDTGTCAHNTLKGSEILKWRIKMLLKKASSS